MLPSAMPDIEETTANAEEINMTRSLNIIVCGGGIAGKFKFNWFFLLQQRPVVQSVVLGRFLVFQLDIELYVDEQS
jgi:hypothetical protein